MHKRKIMEALDRISSKKSVKYAVYLTAVILFFALILLPPLLGIIVKWNAMQTVLDKPDRMSRSLNAIQNSFLVALLVSALDVITGIPMAWFITRGKSKWLNVLDTLADIPFVVPTAALGYSLLLFWSDPNGISSLFGNPLASPGWLLVILLHFTFSYPVVIRVVVGALLDYKIEYEQASRTLGAPPLTASRTVTFAIIKPSLIAAFILAFARSLSETGATFMVAGAFENGPVFIRHITNEFKAGTIDKYAYEGSLAFASFILIAIAVAIFALIRILGPKLKIPAKKTWPSWERKLSYSKAATSRNTVTLLIFLIIVLIPSLFVALPAFQAVFTNILPNSLSGNIPGGVNWGDYWQSILLSYFLGAVVTILNVAIGLPMAILIARRKFGKLLSGMLDVLVNIPLIVPSIALGVSLRFFWKDTFAFMPEMLLLIFAHLAITYPYFVRSMSAATERISADMEEAARTLGAKPLGVFRTIIWPLTKYSIFSGAIIIFTRSVSETGATVAVVSSLKTVPIILEDWVFQVQKKTGPATSLDVGLACGYLILFSFIILLALRLIVRGKGRY
ncbi:MAG: ABC transporter permease subunit [Candidatus Bathyarchaeota archaeon]|nr:iron ABC transporter permease [Candidatus Bathyarchaeota archaeon A05DMB-5]MDH7557878.1 ABC transporter permease subunit [Candidatus Bathyarchaeota archaeon]